MFSWHQLASRALPLPAARLPGPISQGSGFFLNGLGLEVSCEPWKNWLWTLDSLWIFRVFEKFWESLKSWTTNTLEIVRGPHLLRLRLRFRRFRLPRTGNSSPSKKQNTTAKHHYNHYWLQFWSQNCINMAHKVCYAKVLCKQCPQASTGCFGIWQEVARHGKAFWSRGPVIIDAILPCGAHLSLRWLFNSRWNMSRILGILSPKCAWDVTIMAVTWITGIWI